MERKEIEKAAKEYADRKWVLGQRAVCKDGFKAGVDWFIQTRLSVKKDDVEAISKELSGI